MGKYFQDIDINNNNNSGALILRNVTPNSTVLEFGCASGYMTKYLKETLNCKVNIVEISEADGKEASVFADNAFIGADQGNIEKYYWKSVEPCDFIIFADVLEHLIDPWKVLKESVDVLKPDGSILISIPHIGHNAIIIELMKGRFEYKELGILDNTHLRFFTRESLKKMVADAGLKLVKETNTYCEAQDTEFKTNTKKIPEAVLNYLDGRQDHNLYQFVWKLQKR